jgi:hypothetical protein
MKRVCLLLAAGVLLLGGSAVRAGEPVPIPGTLNLAPPHPADSGCAGPFCGGQCHCRHSRNLCDWLLYKPPSCHGACCCVVSSCYPPTYTWFLDMCQGCRDRCGHGGCGHACTGATACGDGGCGKAVTPPVTAAHAP